MKVEQTDLPGVLLLRPQVFEDGRGYFAETYHRARYAEAGIDVEFVQDNESRSCYATLRGLHYQIQFAQGKLVRVVRGEVFDVAVDLRRDSTHFGRWTGTHLSAENHVQLYIPPGFAHGFCVLSPSADVSYKCTDYYHPEHECTLAWDDPQVNIRWPIRDVILSPKDRAGRPLSETPCY